MTHATAALTPPRPDRPRRRSLRPVRLPAVRALSARRVVEAPPAAVWDVLIDTRLWPAWGPTVTAAELSISDPRLRPGSRGRVRTAVGLWLPFQVTEWAEGALWSWRVAGVPATRHTVLSHPAGAEVVLQTPWWAPAYLPVCELAAHRLARLAEGRGPRLP